MVKVFATYQADGMDMIQQIQVLEETVLASIYGIQCIHFPSNPFHADSLAGGRVYQTP